MTGTCFDKHQLDTVQAGLLPGEVAIAIYDSRSLGVGFGGLTNGRVILKDNSFVGGKSALTSLPYRCIQNISYLADKSMWGKFASSSVVSINPNVSDSQFGDLVSVRPNRRCCPAVALSRTVRRLSSVTTRPAKTVRGLAGQHPSQGAPSDTNPDMSRSRPVMDREWR